MNSIEKGWGAKEEWKVKEERWTYLNETYDAKIADMYKNPGKSLDPGELVKLRSMQKEIFELESALFKRFES